MNRYGYYQPETLDEAFRLKKTILESLYISGGTDLMVRIKKRELRPRALISLRSIPTFLGSKRQDNPYRSDDLYQRRFKKLSAA